MTERLGLKSWAAGALMLAAVTGCANRTSAATTSAAPTAPPEVAGARATDTVRNYVATIDEIAQSPTADLTKLDSVTTGSELTAERKFLKDQRDRGERQVGDTSIAQLKVQSISLDNSDPTAGKVPTVVIDVCWDVSKVDVLDRSGKSIVTSSRPDTGWTRYTVANYRYAADPSGGWRVASGQDLEQSTCAAS